MIKVITQDITDGFQWKTTEQVWPFEKASDGSTLYCKELDLGSCPNNGGKAVAHGVVGFSALFKLCGIAVNGVDRRPLPYPSTNSSACFVLDMYNDSVTISTGTDRTMFTAVARLLYTKSI